MSQKRRKIWIDRFQTYLSLRLALYFVLYQAALWSVVLVERGVRQMIGDAWPEVTTVVFVCLASAAVFLGLLFIYDAIVFSHRLVGPLVRFRSVIRAIAAGDEVAPVNLRHGDFLQELKDDVNDMLRALEERGVLKIKSPGAGPKKDQPVTA